MKINIINCSLISLLLITTVFSQEGWFEQISGTTNDLFDVFCIDQNNCWVVGSAGTILKTTNGGTDWISVQSGTSDALYSVFFIDTEIGWSVGSNGTILKSNDGGISWISQISGTNGYLISVQFIDQNTGWIAGDVVLKTTDGGINWVPQVVGPGNSIFFLDQNIGWLIGDHNIYKTTNGGINWDLQTIVSSVDLLLVQFIDQNIGWVGGYYPIPPPVPGTILVTTNGGTDWINPNSYYGLNLTSIYFTDQYTGWAVAIGMYEPGTIHKTTDGGISWNLQYSAFDSFTSVFFTNPNIGWTVGYSGTILKTINGGVPVELTSFTASVLQNEKAVQLNWTTATESNNSGFEILRFTQNDNDWSTIGFVPGFGTTTEPKSYSFTDEDVTTGTYKYRLKQIDFDGSYEHSKEIEVAVDFTPKEFVLYQNYPNPFNPSTTIKFEIPDVETTRRVVFTTLKVYDILGNEVATLVNEEKQPGAYEVEFNLESSIRNPASGVYFYQLKAGSFIQTKKMVLAK
jgi:photosystem II stability/assembly factor-like uncharacterized protein